MTTASTLARAGAMCLLILVTADTTSGQSAAAGTKPSVTLLKLGSETLVGTDYVTLDQSIVDLLGQARNSTDNQLIAFVRSIDTTRWRVAGRARPEPGGVFRMLAIRFPGTGDFELVVGVFTRTVHFEGESIEGETWRTQADAQSDRIAISIRSGRLASEPESGAEAGMPALRIVRVGGTALRPDEKTPIGATGDVVIAASKLPQPVSVYIAKRIPYTDRCALLGPARPMAARDHYVLSGVTFEAAGDPQQLHFELVAWAADAELKTGDASCEALRHVHVIASSPVEVVVDRPRSGLDDGRVGAVAVTRIGSHALAADREPDTVLNVRNGTTIDVAQFEAAVEGTRVFLLTRERGSRVWFAQGPAMRRAFSVPVRDRGVAATWVWMDLRFHRRSEGSENNEFEVVAVMSTSLFPNAIVDSTFPGSKSVQALSRVVRVRVDGVAVSPAASLSIDRVATADVRGSSSPVTVGRSGSVFVRAQHALPDGQTVYVVRHKVGSGTYTLFEALNQGSTYVVPDLSFINPHPDEGARYQLFAIQAWGKVSVSELTYEDLLNLSTGMSQLVAVRYSAGRLAAMQQWLEQLSTDSAERGVTMAIWLVFGAAVAVIGVAVWIAIVAARTFAGRGSKLPHRRDPMFEGGVTRFLVGLGLLVGVVHVIRRYYLDVYPGVISTVANLDDRESLGLAVWLVVITGLLGVSLHLAYEYAHVYADNGDERNARVFQRIAGFCLFAAVLLWLFQGGLYFEMLSLNSFGLTPLLGGIAFTLIAVAETVVFFFITKLTLPKLRLQS